MNVIGYNVNKLGGLSGGMNFEGCDVSSAAVVGARVGTGVGENGAGHPVGVIVGCGGQTGLWIGEDG